MNGQNERNSKSVAAGAKVHEITVEGRERMAVSGVTEVISFDDSCAVLKTVDGELTVEGSGIRIGELDSSSGKVSLSGRIDALFYSAETPERRRGLFGRMFG